jgi:hypothetical protein
MKSSILIALAFLLLFSCEKDKVNNQKYHPIVIQSIYDSLQPQSNYDYYEIRDYTCYNTKHFNIISSFGNYPFNDTVACNGSGVIYTTSDLCMYHVIMSVKGSTVKFWTSYDQIKEFLGTIDNKHEALFLAHLNGYYFQYDSPDNGIIEIEGKFQLVALKLVSMCAPVEIDKFLLEIDSSGNIKILSQEVISKQQNACI